MFGCSNRGGRDKNKRFFRLSSISLHQGDQTKELSKKRRDVRLVRLKQADLKPASYPYVRICSDHFVSGMPSSLYDESNPDWAPSINLGHGNHPPSSRERYDTRELLNQKLAKTSLRAVSMNVTVKMVLPHK